MLFSWCLHGLWCLFVACVWFVDFVCCFSGCCGLVMCFGFPALLVCFSCVAWFVGLVLLLVLVVDGFWCLRLVILFGWLLLLLCLI